MFQPDKLLFPVPFDSSTAPYANAKPTGLQTRFDVPAAFHEKHDGRVFLQVLDLSDGKIAQKYFQSELDVSRLNSIFKHLWIAGLPRIARPLHQHLAKGRTIVIVEQTDCHLTWREDAILLKPLPRFLMHPAIWETRLCQSQELFESACGLLVSYTWLVSYESDFRIAQERFLLPSDITWHEWTTWVASILERSSAHEYKNVSPRYIYGELRIGRLNAIYRFCNLTRGFTTLIRGYNYEYTTYTSFVRRNTTWFLSVAVYITIVLTAMQVGLGTAQLKGSNAFNTASYVFTVFAIVAPILLVAALCPVLLVIMVNNLLYTWKQNRKAQELFKAVSDARMSSKYDH